MSFALISLSSLDMRSLPIVRLPENLRQMQRSTIGALGDLFAAAKAVGDDQNVGVGLPHRRQEHSFRGLHRDVVVRRLEPERARHAAATGVEHLVIETELVEQLPLTIEPDNGMLVAMRLDQRPSSKPRGLVPIPRKELAQHEALLAQTLCSLVIRKEIGQLVPEGRDARRLQPDDRNTGADLGPHGFQNLREQLLTEVEHSPGVERASTRSEEHMSELKAPMRTSYDDLCLQKQI